MDFNKHLIYSNGKLYRKCKSGKIKLAGSKQSKRLLIVVNKVSYKARDIVWILHNGDIPAGTRVKPKNNDYSDDRINNLELTNMDIFDSVKSKINKIKPVYDKSVYMHENPICNINSSTGIKGVSLDKRYNKFIARICIKGKRFHLGSFSTLDIASKVVKSARDIYIGNAL